jgi:hypothetical protein
MGIYIPKPPFARLYQMALEVTLVTFNVMPAQAGIPDFSSSMCRWIAKSWIPACAGMTGFVGQSL